MSIIPFDEVSIVFTIARRFRGNKKSPPGESCSDMVDVHHPIRSVAKLTSVLLLNDVRQMSLWSVFSTRTLLKTGLLSPRLFSFESLRSRLRISSLWKSRLSVDRAVFTAFLHSWKQAVESTRCHGTLRH